MFFYIIITVHLLLCAFMIGLVLLQQGKGADVGAAFGGGSNTVFGASGAKTVVGKLTTGTAVAFMLTSILLVRSYAGMGPQQTRVLDPLTASLVKESESSQAAVKQSEQEKSTEKLPETAGVQVVPDNKSGADQAANKLIEKTDAASSKEAPKEVTAVAPAVAVGNDNPQQVPLPGAEQAK